MGLCPLSATAITKRQRRTVLKGLCSAAGSYLREIDLIGLVCDGIYIDLLKVRQQVEAIALSVGGEANDAEARLGDLSRLFLNIRSQASRFLEDVRLSPLSRLHA